MTTTERLRTKNDEVNWIHMQMKVLNYDEVRSYFENKSDDEGVEPYIVCDGISVEAFNEYIGDSESSIELRFLDLDDDGLLLISEYPVYRVYESIRWVFHDEFIHAFGNRKVIARRGAMTVYQNGKRA